MNKILLKSGIDWGSSLKRFDSTKILEFGNHFLFWNYSDFGKPEKLSIDNNNRSGFLIQESVFRL